MKLKKAGLYADPYIRGRVVHPHRQHANGISSNKEPFWII